MNKHNDGYNKGVHTWTQGINKFSDGTAPGKGYLSPLKISIEEYVASKQTWEDYKQKWNKVYTVAEEPER